MSVGENGKTAVEPTFWAAVPLAKAGYCVFPLQGKEPSVEGGFYASTTDPSQVAEWITEGRENHDVAFATGLPSGIVVMDADTPEAFAEMQQEYGEPTVLTRRGGHWYFRHPHNGKVTSTGVRAGLDRKGDGGYVAAPPSRGRAWTNGIPDRAVLPILPREFWAKKAEKISTPRSMPEDRKDAAVEAIAARVPRVQQGKRHEHLRHLCGVLLARGVAAGDAEDVLIGAWSKAGGDLAERAGREIPNTLATTEQALAEDRATGVPSLEEITPGLYAELESIFAWRTEITFGGKKPGDEGQDSGAPETKEERRNQADRLIGYALEDLGDDVLFVDQHGAPHALIEGESVPLSSRCYSWLRRLMWQEESKAVNGEYLKTAAGTLAAHAEFSGEVRELHTRAAWHEGVLYYELRPGKVVRVDSGGWTFDPKPPVLFRRYPNLKPLPDPKPGGSVKDLAGYVNLKTKRDKRLVVAYATTVPLPQVARPIFNASGPMGAGKTTIGRIIKRLLDPTVPETVRYDPRDILQKAMHAYILMFDNLSSLSDAAADTSCRFVTGEGDSKRKLYTDDEDVIVELKRALIFTGINVPTDRGDVLDRMLPVELERIPDGERKTEEQMWELFDREHPRILGALFDTLSKALAVKPSLQLSRRPRLADWGEYAAAVYEVMGWGAEQFLKDWDEVVKLQNQGTLDGSPVAQAIIKFMEDKEQYAGTSSEAHKKLEGVAESLGVSIVRDKAWPKSARWLWRRIKEILPLLVAAGIEALRDDTDKASVITFRKAPTNDSSDSRTSRNRMDKGNADGIKEESNSSSNSSPASNSRNDSSPNTAYLSASGDTGITGDRYGNSSERPGEAVCRHEVEGGCRLCRRQIERLVREGMSRELARAEVLGEEVAL